MPDANHRLADLRTLIASANLGVRFEGMTIARLLARRGSFRVWMTEVFGQERSDREAIELFRILLDQRELFPIVEITLRHRFALTLRSLRSFDEALEQGKAAYTLDPSNSASAHVLGLIHEARALAGWKAVVSVGDADALGKALLDEREATTFFRQSRAQQPAEEYGYEAEARYLRYKAEILSDAENRTRLPTELSAHRDTALAQGLRLIQEAELRVPPRSLVETRETKARILSQMGDFNGSWSLLQKLIRAAADPSARAQYRELAAAVAVAHKRWSDAPLEATTLVDEGFRSPYVYLLLDEALAALGRHEERRRRLSESAEEWNREDLETLVRWAGICASAKEWGRATVVLKRAERAAQKLGLPLSEQQRVRGTVRGPDGAAIRVTGHVVRLFRSYEGLLQPAGASSETRVYFRESDQTAAREIGTVVEFGISWRVRGLRADNVATVAIDSSTSPPIKG